ncbi:hypothetical protein F441_15571 [Phytophthora nicotianae CJ01A1]|uniref:Uncharacterized protein n=4 Tax=Phytophthora nicotianae TaxID=4792 RepID=W2YNT2_PHYNI|nr:hypothetical protein L915_15293 [Phytophthora nicotianae]ETO67308.1 hypothetical protein F444_15728 [Phytophthora nicotianae P1976]ETP08451.1 hypothetical protein F441_15571 [Phytophthora nicotianae CJ01A1]ETP36487.1 hypothetical protein F442_15584 [Phytophthora nicotianae P10297]ETL32194.1 hypothetical protein L916_15184 [Phytophthora nicotianae]
MSRQTDTYELLVQHTVRDVLFSEPSNEKQTPAKHMSMADKIEIQKDSLLSLLLNSENENPAENEDNNADEARSSWLLDCPYWSIERLRREKAAIKRYLHSQKFQDNGSKLSGDMLMLHEAYALLKLFLLERDPVYLQYLQQSIGCSSSFLTSLHVQLTLYATYFERAHGRQISKMTDVEPIGTLYELFLKQTE